MKRLFILLVTYFFLLITIHAQDIKTVKIEELKKEYIKTNDTTYIINFFATWCGPCVQEMPVINKFYQTAKTQKIQLIFVSLDGGIAPAKLQKFIKKQKMEAPVFILNESSDFSWLPYIDKRWQGSIPATMIVNAEKKVKAFFETPMENGQLEFYLKKLGL
ncbi:MAG: TlpA disulfide reductase family protein [Chitinophagales bacterium]